MAKIKDLEDMAIAIHLQCAAMDQSLKDKLGIAYEVVVQWRINKVLRRLRRNDDGSKRPDGGNPIRASKRTRKPAPELPLHLPGLAPSSRAPMDPSRPRTAAPANAE